MSRLVTFEDTVLSLEISDLKVETLTISLSKVLDRFISFSISYTNLVGQVSYLMSIYYETYTVLD